MKKILKSILSEPLGWSNQLFFGKELRTSLTIFIYHDVTENPAPFSKTFDLNVKPDLFDFQVGFIKKHFNVIGPDDLLAGDIPEQAAMITFDDGMAGYFTDAVPILTSHKVPSLSFLNMNTVRGDVLWAALLSCLAVRSDFVDYVKDHRPDSSPESVAQYLVDQAVVEDFLQNTGLHLDDEVKSFTGAIASESDVKAADANPYVYYGNHLDNHYVASLMTDEQLLLSFQNNRDALKKYSSSRDIFSFPFGQPGRHFKMGQAELLLKNGADKVFFSSGKTNVDSSLEILDRVPLGSFETTENKVWFRVFRQR